MPVDVRPVVALFERESQAREVARAVEALGIDHAHLGVLVPGHAAGQDAGDLLGQAATASERADLSQILSHIGVPEGEARFYADEARHGRTLVVVSANGRAEEVRRLALEHGGYDVQSRGAEFIRGGSSGVPGGVGARPMDVTSNWEDFRSRYEMLWQQHYGTTDATWEQMEPVYRYAWQLANLPKYRGRPWTEVEGAIGRGWPSSGLSGVVSWSDAAGPLRDVWEDVAEEAATGAEGGADRRIASSGSDQSVAARDVESPTQGAA